jgi:hypothetical protein
VNSGRSSSVGRYTVYSVILLSALLSINCSSVGDLTELIKGDQPSSDQMTLAEALATEPEDRRGTVLEELGAPDAFSVRFETVEGQVVRWESWSYFDFGSSFDFVDGELLWTVELDPLPDGSLYAHFYVPEDFQAHMTTAEVRELLPWQSLVEVDLGEGDIEGGVVLAGDQILLGFDQDRLVYVETFVLAPEEGELAGSPLPTPTTQMAPSDAPTSTASSGAEAPREVGALVLQDDFESADPKASALFPPEFMTFDHIDGQARLVSNSTQGVIGVTYSTPLLEDFIAEFDVTTESLAPGATAGLIFRGTPGGQLTRYYNLVLRPADGHVGLETWKDGEWALWEFRPIPSALLPNDGAYHLRLEAQGANFRVFVNGSFVTEFIDAQIPDAGIVGLSLAASQPPEAAFFDNLRIYQLP